MPRYRVSDALLSRSRSPAWQAKRYCYVINVCETETRFRLRRPQLLTLHVCACLCACSAPVPVHCTGVWTAEDVCSRETVGGRLPSCPTVITRRGKRQTTNVSACKFAEID